MTPSPSGEVDLVRAILTLAVQDLGPRASALERERSHLFFRNEHNHLELLCGLVDLDYHVVQQRVFRLHPEVQHPAQLPLFQGGTPISQADGTGKGGSRGRTV
jgi:hypothetical protein